MPTSNDVDEPMSPVFLPVETKLEILSFCDTPHAVASLARLDRSFASIAEPALYQTISLEATDPSALACLETLATNPAKAALVESLGIDFTHASRLPRSVVDTLKIAVQHTSQLRHIDFDWNPLFSDDEGLTIMNEILTTPGLSLTSLHGSESLDFARIVRHHPSLTMLGIHRVLLKDTDDLLRSFREIFIPGYVAPKFQWGLIPLQPFHGPSPSDGDLATAETRTLPTIFLLPQYDGDNGGNHRGISLLPGLFPARIAGMCHSITEHLGSPLVKAAFPGQENPVSEIDYATVHWLELPPFEDIRLFFEEMHNEFPAVTTLNVWIKPNKLIDYQRLSKAMSPMEAIDTLNLYTWEAEDHDIIPAFIPGGRQDFLNLWIRAFPRLKLIRPLDNFRLTNVDGVWVHNF